MTTQTTATVPGTEISLYNQAKWSRATVADGKWLQNETLEPISANDRILASAINYVSGGVDYVSARVTLLEDASDVINVYGDWNDFINNSANLFVASAITDNDIIKVLNDENSYPNELFPDAEELTSGHQTYFRWTVTAQDPHKPIISAEGKWNYIGYLNPYYNTSEIDDIIDDLSATVDDRIDDLSATVKSEYVPLTADPCHIGKNNVYNDNDTGVFVQGQTNTAYQNSLAQGTKTSANSIAFAQGSNTSAYVCSLAQGYGNIANIDSLAQGNENSALSTAFAQGNKNSANNYAFAQGTQNTAFNYAFAQGSENNAKNNALAQGYKTYADNYSIAQGLATSAIANSQAFGVATCANSSGMAIGVYNKTYDGVFVIGNGTDESHRSDLFLINKNGDTTSIGAAYFTGFSGTNISGLTQTASIDNLINSAANGGGMTAVKSISGFTIDNSTGSTQEIELQSSADHLNIALSGSIKNSITLYGQQDIYGNHYLYIQGTELLKKADFDDWASSTTSVFSGTSRSAINANSATYAYSAQKAESAEIAYSATSAHNAEYLGAKLPSAYMQVANIGRDANGNISSYGGSAIAGLGDYVPKSATNCPIGTNNTAVSYAFAQGITNSADTTAFAQGDSNKVSFVSFAQGSENTAANYSLAQGWKSSAERHAMTQGVSNTAYNLSFAQGDLNFADGLSLAQGEQTLARWASIAQGSGTSATNRSQAFGEGTVASASGMAIGTYNKTYDATFVIGNGTDDSNRSDLVVIDHNGKIAVSGNYGGTSYDAAYGPSGVHLSFAGNRAECDLTVIGVSITGSSPSTSYSAKWTDIINPGNFVSAMGALPIVISAVTRLPPTLDEGIYYLV